MITEERCKKLLQSAGEVGIDAVMIISPINRTYFSGFTGSNGVLLITERSRILFTDFRYTIQAKEQTGGVFEVREVSGPISYELISAELEKQNCVNCGYEEDFMTVRQYAQYRKMKAEMNAVTSIISSIRMVKTEDEIEKLIAAQNIADRAFGELLGMLQPGMTEREVAMELEYFMKKFGADEPSFDTIVGSGPNGALCHAMPSDRKLTHGDMVVIDFGARKDGYCSDMTRTIAIGEPCEELQKIYKIVREAQALTLRGVKPGMEGKKLDAIARDCITARGYGDCFGHSLGHGFGLEVHEGPAASVRSVDVLRPGNTITVEPGIYVEGLGGVRIEDCLIVTETGFINPVTTTKDLIIIE